MNVTSNLDIAATELQTSLDALTVEGCVASALLICRNADLLDAVSVPSGMIVASELQSADQLPLSARYAAVIIIDQLEQMPIESGLALLARLRDCHSDDVLLHLAGNYSTAQELLALGFMPIGEQGEGRWFRYQRDMFYEKRSWNTPEQWAHPENFRRNRW